MENDTLTEQVIAAAIEVHRRVCPGAVGSTYERCLVHELGERELSVARPVELLVGCKGVTIDCGYRIDLLVEGRVIIELKAVDGLAPIHEAQPITYWKLSGHRRGLPMNFNVRVHKEGLVRRVL